jgi:hypothetical protein
MSAPRGIRILVLALRGLRPRPLDDGGRVGVILSCPERAVKPSLYLYEERNQYRLNLVLLIDRRFLHLYVRDEGIHLFFVIWRQLPDLLLAVYGDLQETHGAQAG